VTRRLGVAALAALLAVAPAASAADRVEIRVDRTAVSTSLGRDLSIRTTIANRGSGPTAPLVAHLNVLSLRPGVYVDPEDWSSSRTRYLGVLPAGGSGTIDWTLKAVNSGTFALYVAVLPESGHAVPTTGPAVRIDVARRQTLDAGGILPLAAGMPAALALLALGIRLRRRRR
jgi:hypothetical protein